MLGTENGGVAQADAGGRLAVGLDVGGTKIAGGVVNAAGDVLAREQVPTPADGDATAAAMEQVIARLQRQVPAVVTVGVGAAGLVEWPGGYIRWAPNNSYHALPLRERLEQATGLPVVVDNDANVAAWAEIRFGAGAGASTMVLITVGTGIGGGLVLDGKVFHGATGLGAELGHIPILPDGPVCGCGLRGCLESLAAGTALGRTGREAAAADPHGLIAQLAGSPDKVTGLVVSTAARQGDPTARRLIGEVGRWLGVGVASVNTLFDPEVVVIGGGLVEVGDLLLAPTRASFEQAAYGRAHRTLPPVVPARLGPEAGMVGAATFALSLLADGGLAGAPAAPAPAHRPRPSRVSRGGA